MDITNKFNKIINIFSYKDLKKCIIIASIMALIVRIPLLWIESGDYTYFLKDWCDYIKSNGGFKAITTVEADYNAIYLYFLAFFTYLPIKYIYPIKLLSITFDYLLAYASYLLVNEFYKDNKDGKVYATFAYIGVLFMPTVILNSSMWGQCDSIYTFFIVLSMYFMITKRYNYCFIMYGFAITFKLQSIFVLPVYGILYLKNREFSIFKFTWVPFINVLLYIPAVMLGKPITSVFEAYTTQTQSYDYKTVFGYPNFYNFLPLDAVELIKPGIVLAMIILGLLTIFILCTKPKLSNTNILKLTIVIVYLVTYFLPKMHDRYAFVAEIMVLLYFIITKKDVLIVMVVNICALFVYSNCLFGLPDEFTPYVSVVQTFIVGFYLYKFIKERITLNIKSIEVLES